MAGNNKVPERLINFRVYAEGNDLLGVANVELPSLEAMSDTVSGAGIAGEVESPILGHYGSMTTTFTWRTISADLTRLAEQKAHALLERVGRLIFVGRSKFTTPHLENIRRFPCVFLFVRCRSRSALARSKSGPRRIVNPSLRCCTSRSMLAARRSSKSISTTTSLVSTARTSSQAFARILGCRNDKRRSA